MAGTLSRISPRIKYDFANLLGNGATQEYVVAKAIDATAVREADLIVKVHVNALVAASNQSVVVSLRSESPSLDDPTNDYVFGTSASSPTDLTYVTITPGTGALVMLMNSANVPSTGIGSHLRVVVKGVQANPGVGGFYVTLSIDLALKA